MMELFTQLALHLPIHPSQDQDHHVNQQVKLCVGTMQQIIITTIAIAPMLIKMHYHQFQM